MPIYDFKTKTAHYLQVRVKWAGKERYAYVRVKRSRDVAMREAIKEEARLLERRKAYNLRVALKHNYLSVDGKVIGITEYKGLQNKRSGVYQIHEFKCRINHEGKIYFKHVSIMKHGYEGAYRLAVGFLCSVKRVNSYDYMLLLRAIDAYREPTESHFLRVFGLSDYDNHSNTATVKILPDDFKENLEKEINEFQNKNKKVISGLNR